MTDQPKCPVCGEPITGVDDVTRDAVAWGDIVVRRRTFPVAVPCDHELTEEQVAALEAEHGDG